MSQTQAPRPHLDRRAWAMAGLEALARGGPSAVAVEPVARRLGTTKGSFYWHFPDRRALLLASLELYEAEGTETVISRLEQSEPDHRLRRLFALVFRDEGGDPVYHELLANAGDADVAPVLRRITARRVDYLAQTMTGLGHAAGPAYQRAVLAYTTWLGLVQTERAMGGRLFPSKQARNRYLAFVQDTIGPPDLTS